MHSARDLDLDLLTPDTDLVLVLFDMLLYDDVELTDVAWELQMRHSSQQKSFLESASHMEVRDRVEVAWRYPDPSTICAWSCGRPHPT